MGTGRAISPAHRGRHESLYEEYLETLSKRWPRFKLVHKRDSPLCRSLNVLLRALTFGKQSRFMTHYVTTLGDTVYLPELWSDWSAGRRYCVMRHEVVHISQFKRWRWPGMCFLYLLFPLPCFFSLGRAWLEWQAYAETLRATWQVYGERAANDPALRREIVARFTGADYGWMWVLGSQVDRLLARELDTLRRDPPESLYPECSV